MLLSFITKLWRRRCQSSHVYFERDKEKILLLYLNQDMSLPNFLKVVRGSVLVDKEALPYLKLENHVSTNNAQGEGELKDDSEF